MSTQRLPTFPAGTVINNRYELRRKLGSDGNVYEARDGHFNKAVAVKLLDPTEGESSRTWDEARRLEELKNRCLLDVLNADVDGPSDIRFIVTPLVSDGDLESMAKGAGLGLQRAARVMRHVTAGIDRIHAAGMIHRDIKPGNILVDGDDVRVSDLGYCAILDDDGTALPNGTWQTVVPEVAAKNRCSVASDVYSLGATAFFAYSGEYPVSTRLRLEDQVERIKAGDTRELRDLAPHVPQSVAKVVRKALQLDPKDRFQSADEFGNALVGAMDGRRDWSRTRHAEHVFCVLGQPHKSKTAVAICCLSEGTSVRLTASHTSSNRRVRGCDDVVVSEDRVPKELRKLVTSLS